MGFQNNIQTFKRTITVSEDNKTKERKQKKSPKSKTKQKPE